MTWSGSAMFNQWTAQVMGKTGTGWGGLSGDTINVALFNNTTTPDKTVAVGSTGYNTGQWVTGNEVTSTNWAAGGVALGSKTLTAATSSNVFTFDAADTSGGGTVTLTNAFGCLVYDNAITAGTVAKQGITFHDFGGGQSVTSGTFTIVWNASGLFTVTV